MYHGERFNFITHLLGAVAAAAGVVWLAMIAVQSGDARKVVSFTVYGTTLFLLYLVSTLYHSISGRTKMRWQKLDHLEIYLLIAGTYTPFTLLTLNGIALGKARRILQGESPCRERVSHPPVSSVDLIEEPVMVNKIVR